MDSDGVLALPRGVQCLGASSQWRPYKTEGNLESSKNKGRLCAKVMPLFIDSTIPTK